MPAVIDKARNPRVREGEVGYVSIATDVLMLQVPDNPSRAGGDIHIFGILVPFMLVGPEAENRLFFQVTWALGPHKHERY